MCSTCVCLPITSCFCATKTLTCSTVATVSYPYHAVSLASDNVGPAYVTSSVLQTYSTATAMGPAGRPAVRDCPVRRLIRGVWVVPVSDRDDCQRPSTESGKEHVEHRLTAETQLLVTGGERILNV